MMKTLSFGCKEALKYVPDMKEKLIDGRKLQTIRRYRPVWRCEICGKKYWNEDTCFKHLSNLAHYPEFNPSAYGTLEDVVREIRANMTKTTFIEKDDLMTWYWKQRMKKSCENCIHKHPHIMRCLKMPYHSNGMPYAYGKCMSYAHKFGVYKCIESFLIEISKQPKIYDRGWFWTIKGLDDCPYRNNPFLNADDNKDIAIKDGFEGIVTGSPAGDMFQYFGEGIFQVMRFEKKIRVKTKFRKHTI